MPLRRLVAFALAAGALLWYALPEGSYDIVARQEKAVAIWWVIGLGGALGFIPRVRAGRKRLGLLVLFGLLVAWTALALLWTSSDERTLAEVARTVQYAGVVAIVWCLVGRSTWRPAAAGIAAAAVAVCALGLASRFSPDTFPDTVARAFELKRLSYPLGYWNAMAAWGAMTVAMLLVWSAHARDLPARVASLAGVPVAALVVYLTYSRAGVAGTGLALLAALALSVNRWTTAAHALFAAGGSALAILAARSHPEIADGDGTAGAAAVLLALLGGVAVCCAGALLTHFTSTDRLRLPLRLARAATAAVVVVGVVVLLTLGRAPLSDAWADFKDTEVVVPSAAELSDPSARLTSLKGTRYDVWASAVDATRGDPLTGVGPGTFEFFWNQDEGSQFIRDVHSLYLEQAAELGVVGLALTVAVLLGLLALGIAARLRLTDPSHAGAAAALCAALVVYLLHAAVDWMWESTAVTVLALAAGALASGNLQRRRSSAGWPSRAALAAAALGACLVALPGLLSTTELRESRLAFRAGDASKSLSAADTAVSRQPWAASPYVQRALVRWSDGDLSSAARDLDRARTREPENWRHPLLLARLEAERGRTREAIGAFRRARSLRPRSPFVAPPVRAAPTRPPQ